MEIAQESSVDRAEVADLYNSVGWLAYTRNPKILQRSIEGSHLVLTARNDDGLLLGLLRTVSDGETVCYVQDILIRPDAQRQGIGRALLVDAQKRYAHCRFFLLSTDHPDTEDARKSHPFYRSLGMIPHEEQGMAAFGLPVNR
ncbi:GNAT family N-acetyltransferase [Arthrobacter sp. H5]|uniref:GNAT family N-acetyltransferase n=1 Tax=Arthrobacter sp. H5 TaxID=1267973 RepID=UPI000480F74E|nr:GNAT family N-acetyltransferase [Arthrobacter sp. H5]